MSAFRISGICLLLLSLPVTKSLAQADHDHIDHPSRAHFQDVNGQGEENALFASQSSDGGLLAGTGGYDGPAGFDRGMQATQYCGNSPESWIRGSAYLDRTNGHVTIHMDLETDSVLAGPRGKIRVTVKDQNGNSVASTETSEAGIGGKLPGTFRLVKVSGSADIPAEVAQNAASMWVEADCTGSQDGLFGIFGNATDVLKFAFALING